MKFWRQFALGALAGLLTLALALLVSLKAHAGVPAYSMLQDAGHAPASLRGRIELAVIVIVGFGVIGWLFWLFTQEDK